MDPTTVQNFWSAKAVYTEGYTRQVLDRSSRVIAYAMAHAQWILNWDIPSYAEVATMRICYGLPTTSAVEWDLIYNGHVLPALKAGVLVDHSLAVR
jgi:hypothetical protein